MDWKEYKNKKVFIQLKGGIKYSGTIIDIDESALPIVFISMIDKFGEKVSFVTSEIIKIVEERG